MAEIVQTRTGGLNKRIKWQHVALFGVIMLSLFLHFFAIGKEGYSNPYYSAAVKSMLENPTAFFFGSFDSGLFVTVDKPALGLWLQALSCAVFGVNAFGLILPSALAGTASIWLVFGIVKERWGETAGVIAAAIGAATPIIVAVSRTNNLDMIMVFFLLCGAKLVLRAAEKQSLWWYMLAMVFVGLGFNVKMLQAFLVVPAFVFVYFIGKGKFAAKLWHTVIALVLLVGVSLSWCIVVDIIPDDERPYVGGSETNSAIELAIGYNGIARLNGVVQTQDGQMIQDMPNGQMPQDMQSEKTTPNTRNEQRQNILQNVRGGNPGGTGENGETGVFRLFSTQLSGLISWFLLPALVMTVLALVFLVRYITKRNRVEWTDEQRRRLMHNVFWVAWMVPTAVFFSIAAFMHRYYTVMLFPAIAALTAAGTVAAWWHKRRRVLMIAGFAATLALQCVIVSRSSWSRMLMPMFVVGLIAVALMLVDRKKIQAVAAVMMAIVLIAAPLSWSATTVFGQGNARIPDAGPDMTADSSTQAMQGVSNSEMMMGSLVDNYEGERWALAVNNANIAAPIILETGLPVMAVGGFNGSDVIMTVDDLCEYAASGQLRFYLLTADKSSSSNELDQWVRENGERVNAGSIELYDISNAVE